MFIRISLWAYLNAYRTEIVSYKRFSCERRFADVECFIIVFSNLFIKISNSLSHFTDGKTKAQSKQEACCDEASCFWAAVAVWGAPLSSLGLQCVAISRSFLSLGILVGKVLWDPSA